MSIARLQRYRLLLVVYGIAVWVGSREYLVSRNGLPIGGPAGCEASAASCFSISSTLAPTDDSTFWRHHAELVKIMASVNPDDPDTEFLKGMQSMAEGDEAEFTRRFEQAISAGVKHNYFLLQYYAQHLVNRGADWRLVNDAVNRWRDNHPFSQEPISIQLGIGPRTPSDTVALQRALSRVPWVARARLERVPDQGSEQWRVLLSFRPGRTIDMREAMAAVTILAIPEEQRSLYEVTCYTLQDCNATRLPGR